MCIPQGWTLPQVAETMELIACCQKGFCCYDDSLTSGCFSTPEKTVTGQRLVPLLSFHTFCIQRSPHLSVFARQDTINLGAAWSALFHGKVNATAASFLGQASTGTNVPIGRMSPPTCF